MVCQINSQLFLGNPLDKFKLARQAKLGKITIQGINRIVMLALENLIPCYDVARLAINDINFGDEAVYYIFNFNHVINIVEFPRKVKHLGEIIKLFF